MSITPFQALACPLEGLPLHRGGSAWCCTSGHSHDIAGQGYTNLLPVQNKRSRDPDDSNEMAAAQRHFPTIGLYPPIAAAVSRVVLVDLPAGAAGSGLDAGCSEAYYRRQLAAAVPDEQTLALLGLDVSSRG
jgi:23S rRNA (guanine745-N1)-methyltransferase